MDHVQDEEDYRIVDPYFEIRDERTHLKPTYMSNEIRTSKYNWINFFPVCLFQEFKRLANVYFLAIAILQSIPQISPLTPVTAIAPLVIVVSVSLLREVLEDQKKKRLDRFVNGKSVALIRNCQDKSVEWEEIQVGDIIKVSERDMIPADGILLASSEEDGSCFIDTTNLDGEANLKSRQAIQSTLNFDFYDRTQQSFFIKCEQPDQDLYQFSGNITIHGSKMYSLNEKQFLLRGATLMNTKWIKMIVVYTGHETKIMKNARDAHHKMSHVENLMSKTVILFFLFQVVLCAIGAILHATWRQESHWVAFKYTYLTTSEFNSILTFLSYVVLLNTLIPISLVVSVEIIKGMHAKFIQWDNRMRNQKGEGAFANTSSLTDELGQVKYIFTDKTGTLTQNQMVFRKCSVDGMIFTTAQNDVIVGHGNTNNGGNNDQMNGSSKMMSKGTLDIHGSTLIPKDHTFVSSSSSSSSTSTTVGTNGPTRFGGNPSTVYPSSSFSPLTFSAKMTTESLVNATSALIPPPNLLRNVTSFRGSLNNLNSKESRLALGMGLCHTVVCESDPNNTSTGKEIHYNSDSPDECALVRGAALMGVKLLERNGNQLFLSIIEEGREKSYLKTVTYTVCFEILRVLHFSSDRKRMSVIVRDMEGNIKVICKGADSVILDRCQYFLSPRQITLDHVQQFAIEGYRILLFAERTLDQKYYEEWENRLHEAELDIHSKGKKVEALMEEIECELTLIGASAVEDKLQEGVPETISLFQKAGIKIWVLTGDKLETALEMGKLCRVVTPGMKEVILKATSNSEMAREIEEALGLTVNNTLALIIDGASLTLALAPINRKNFLHLALKCATVIVCRTSPLQKALVVELVKTGVPYVTLAVGDGANDVSMIRAAHVGVGVTGQEGMQAVRSADYAVQQFSHLGRLLLHHGRLSYIRTAQCINYFFYKNIVFTLPQFLYGLVSVFSGQTFYCDMYISAYNVMFTALPVVTRAIMETDLPERIAETFPELYRAGAADEYFSMKTLFKNSGMAVCHAIILTFVPLLLFQGMGSWSATGISGDFWSASVASFYYIVPLVHFQIFLETWNWTSLVLVIYLASLSFFIGSVAVYDKLEYSVITDVWGTIFVTPTFWLGFFLAVMLCLVPWIAFKCFQENFVTTHPVHILRRVRFYNKIVDAGQLDSQHLDDVTTNGASLRTASAQSQTVR